MLFAVLNSGERRLRRAGMTLLIFSATFSTAWFIAALFQRLPFLGGDFRVYYTSGLLFLQGRASEIYDPEVQEDLQSHFIQTTLGVTPVGDFVLPMPYLPAGVLLFMPLAAMPPMLAYYLWTALSVFLFLVGLRWLSSDHAVAWRALLLLAAGFFPLLQGLMVGQVHTLLFLGMVGFYLSLKHGNKTSAGAWLSLLLFKPQYLPLLLIVLLWKRHWSVLRAFLLITIGILVLSVLVVGEEGISGYQALLTGHTGSFGPRAISPESMVNWRAFSLFVFGPWRQGLAWLTVAVLSAATILLALLPWKGLTWGETPPQQLELLMLGLIAATVVSAYHSHSHGFVLALVPSIAALVSKDSRPLAYAYRWLIDLVVFGPTIIILVWGAALGRTGVPYSVANLILILMLGTCVAVIGLGKGSSVLRRQAALFR